MKRFFLLLIVLFLAISIQAQVTSTYTISFEKAIYHEATVKVTFSNLKSDEVEFRMSRSSPGRYAIHEFAKNVYDVKVTDGKGKVLKATRPNPYAWQVKGHDGSIQVSYTLFANHGDGTYAQIDETHAHLNMPATFMYVPELSDKGMEVTFKIREDLNWKIATQLKHQEDNTYFAENLQYFMDSPVEIADFKKRSFRVKDQTINLVLHDEAASEEDADTYIEQVKKIVHEQEQVFGELPKFDFDEYTFLACYMPNATGDGMEHRNSTYVVSQRSLATGGIEQNIGTVAHEFFHCWNVERIRPKALEPFRFDEANMSGELWFAEGFTSYYDDLSLVRSGIITREKYIQGLIGTFNYVWTSPARQFFNPMEMSYQAPFVDAAKSVDEVNRENTFISYYSYGSMLGLALDLSLRYIDLNLDDYMKLVWNTYGKTQIGYTVEDLHKTLNTYAGKTIGDRFFNGYIYKSEMPDYSRLLNQMGVSLELKHSIDFGANVRSQKLKSNPIIGTAAYEAGLQKDDEILQVESIAVEGNVSMNAILNNFKVGDKVKVAFERFGNRKETTLTIKTEVSYDLSLMADNTDELTEKAITKRNNWLKSKQ